MQGLHDRLQIAGEDGPGPVEHRPDCIVDETPLFRPRALEHVVDRVPPGGGAADAEADPREVAGSEMAHDVTQPVVPSVAAPFLEPHGSGGEVEVVMHHEDRCGRDSEVLRDRSDRLTAPVHVGRRLDEPHAPRLRACLAGIEREAPSRSEFRPEASGEPVGEPEPRIVSGFLVLRARVAETDDKLRAHRHEAPPSHGALLRCQAVSAVSAPFVRCRFRRLGVGPRFLGRRKIEILLAFVDLLDLGHPRHLDADHRLIVLRSVREGRDLHSFGERRSG